MKFVIFALLFSTLEVVVPLSSSRRVMVSKTSHRLTSTESDTKKSINNKKKKRRRLGLITFDLDDTLYPIAPIHDEANASNFGYVDIRPSNIVETVKEIRATLAPHSNEEEDGGIGTPLITATTSSSSSKDPLKPRTVSHKEIRMAAIRKEMKGFILRTKLRQTAALRIPHPPPRISCAAFLCQRSSSSSRYNNIVSLCSRPENDNDDDDVTNNDVTIHASEYIDFDDMDNKLFDDLQDYGTIRSLESPYENYEPIDPLSVDEIELWMQKNNLRNKKQQQQRIWSTLFPWISPLTSLILPRRHSAPPDLSSRRKTKVDNTRRTSNNLNNAYFTSSPFIRGFLSTPNSARHLIISINIASFLYQIITAVWYLPGFNRVLAASVAGNTYEASTLLSNNNNIIQWTPMEVVLRALGLVCGGAGVVIASSGSTFRGVLSKGIVRRGTIAAHSMGPYFLDFAHQPYPLSSYQKHRYLSSGFLHGSLLHIGMNLRALLSIPLWLENGIGKGVYLSAYLVAIVTSNIAQTLFTIGDLSGRSASSLCIGASGGICGLYGLMLSSLLKMGNADASYYVLKNMAWLLLFGYLVPSVSNAAHLGGLVGGVLVGYLFGPGYERSYSLNRADGFARDKADPEFRHMMGPGIYPSMEKAIFPLKCLWMCVGLAIVAKPELRLIPIALVRGILEPGSLSGTRVLLRNL